MSNGALKDEGGEGACAKTEREPTKTPMVAPRCNKSAMAQVKLLSKATKLLNIQQQDYCCRFGWYTIGGIHLPYVLRDNEMYFSKRMIEMKLLNSSCYLTALHQELYDIACISSSCYAKKSEVRLWNEINFHHCDSQFGAHAFSESDTMFKLHDLVNYYDFLLFCYAKLMSQAALLPERCGFISINKQGSVPYTIHQGRTYLPLFYFEGEVGVLKPRTLILGGWDLSYLKFCFKVQEIRRELYQIGLCEVLDLEDAKLCFPAGSTFDKYWPGQSGLKNLLLTSAEAARPVLAPAMVNNVQQQPFQPAARVAINSRIQTRAFLKNISA